MPIKVLVAADVDQSFYRAAENDVRLKITRRTAYREEALANVLAESAAEVLVTRYQNEVTRRVIDSAGVLKLIVQGTSGLDNIDHDAAASRGIQIAGLPGENANAVAELVIGFAISLTRTVPLYTEMVRAGNWVREDCATRRELRSHKLGIIGLGRVGGRVATLARAFGMECLAYDTYLTGEIARARGAHLVGTLDELLADSDIVTMHVPLTGETRRMISGPQLAAMRKGAILINSCRGGVLDLEAAFDALQREHLSGLALDVYDPEPPAGITFPSSPRLILTPHIAGCSRESKESIGGLIYREIVKFFFAE